MQHTPRLAKLRPRLAGARCCSTRGLGVRATGKSAQYNELMLEKMRWDPENPYEYNFDRGLYYHHILDGQLLCGSQPTSQDDIRYLKDVESVDVIISVWILLLSIESVDCIFGLCLRVAFTLVRNACPGRRSVAHGRGREQRRVQCSSRPPFTLPQCWCVRAAAAGEGPRVLGRGFTPHSLRNEGAGHCVHPF
jgi:hypothetical protein